MADDRILWTRPGGCSCLAHLTGEPVGEPGPYQLVRDVNTDCPHHGAAASRLEAAVAAVLEEVRHVPGMDDVSANHLRRIFRLAIPYLTGQAPPPTPAPAPTPEPTTPRA